ncbi:MAG: sugar ABC transporter ATP-binding protein [Halanaerobiales bacterium]|nr:sugar ABC transporter ATP-binding protein [Halanaerobiales bacterium]
MEYRLSMNKINKTFPGVQALSNVKLDLVPGEVHVLLGENGAGKSTLMKILAGVYPPDQGEILINGQKVVINNTGDAASLGISMIYQELNLIPDLTVVENIFINRELIQGWPGRYNWKEMNRQAGEILADLNLAIDPGNYIRDLSVAQQQMVEIVRSISSNSKIIIMDEPTAALAEQEITELFKQIKLLKEKTVSIIYISHRLPEVKEIGDRVTVLRDGKYVSTEDAKRVKTEQLIKMMVGRDIKEFFPKEDTEKGSEVLRVKNLKRKGVLDDISFSLQQGEVLGFAGLMGSGRTELMRAIFGADQGVEGKIYVKGTELVIDSPETAVKNGIALLTEDRKSSGLILNFAVYQNISLATLEKYAPRGVIDQKRERKRAGELVVALKIKTPGLETVVNSLSGGNQQKVILARWLYRNAEIIILDEPTRGIDVGAKVEIYQLINQLTKQGKAVIMVSSDLPEILAMSDRIAVMYEGKLNGILSREEAGPEKIMQLATGVMTMNLTKEGSI